MRKWLRLAAPVPGYLVPALGTCICVHNWFWCRECCLLCTLSCWYSGKQHPWNGDQPRMHLCFSQESQPRAAVYLMSFVALCAPLVQIVSQALLSTRKINDPVCCSCVLHVHLHSVPPSLPCHGCRETVTLLVMVAPISGNPLLATQQPCVPLPALVR